MRLITQFELARLSTHTLRRLHRSCYVALTQSNIDSSSRRNALASLENIERELGLRLS